jgi:hypothetical protein
MLNKHSVILFFLVLAFYFANFSCTSPTVHDNDNSDNIPKPISVTVKYMRVLPAPNPEASDLITLYRLWGFLNGGNTGLLKIAENTFQADGVEIITETMICMYVADPKWYKSSSPYVCKYIYINGHELATNSTYGFVYFRYENDGKIHVVEPGIT